MTDKTDKKGISRGAVRTIIALTIALYAAVFIAKGGSCSSLEMRDIAVYTKMNEACTAENTPAVKEVWDKETQLIVGGIEPIDEDLIVDIGEAFPIYKKDGAKAVKALKKKWVRFPKMAKSLLATDSCISVMEHYKKDGVDLAQEIAVDTGLKGTCGFPIILPKHFWEIIQEAAKKAELKEIKIAWGFRDSNLQAVMFVRSVHSACGEYPSSASEDCMKRVSRNIAGKPGKIGFTHFFSADIDNWRAMKKELLDRGFAVGCSGVGEKDERHTTWSMSPHNASTYCTVSTWWKRVKIF